MTPLSAEAAAIFDVDVAEVSFASFDSQSHCIRLVLLVPLQLDGAIN